MVGWCVGNVLIDLDGGGVFGDLCFEIGVVYDWYVVDGMDCDVVCDDVD